MKSKKVWNVVNASPDIAWESPLEPDVFLVPVGAVDQKPPDFKADSQTCSFDGKEWIVKDIAVPEEAKWVEPEPPEEYVVPANDLPDYIFERTKEYGQLHEQIEFITENGLDVWQARVAEIKKKHPKP